MDFNQRTNEWSLIIQDVKPADEGVYQCQISTKLAQKKAYDIKLNVKSEYSYVICKEKNTSIHFILYFVLIVCSFMCGNI